MSTFTFSSTDRFPAGTTVKAYLRTGCANRSNCPAPQQVLWVQPGSVKYGRYLTSADSMAWSFRARRDWPSCR